MTRDQKIHFETLRAGPCVPEDYLRDYYGLAWPPLSDPGAAAFHNYLGSLPRRVGCPQGHFSRYELEGFMSRNDVLSRKWMGVRLGMDVASLEVLLSKLGIWGMQSARYVVGSDFVAESLSEDLVRHIPGLRFRTFGNHTAFCEGLHAELKAVGITVEPVFCATSEKLGEPSRFAAHFDCITLEPLSTEHSTWLDFRKPLSLPPDRCSKLLYVENRDLLRPYSAGTGEPDGLGEYERHLQGAAHG